jgi:hypothetical protein
LCPWAQSPKETPPYPHLLPTEFIFELHQIGFRQAVAFSKEIGAKHQTSRSTIETSNQIQPNIAMAIVAK